jgi:hypothetical protein
MAAVTTMAAAASIKTVFNQIHFTGSPSTFEGLF